MALKQILYVDFKKLIVIVGGRERQFKNKKKENDV